MPDVAGDVLVVGGSLGGVAAALAAAASGARVHLLAEDGWVGGQLTVQGVATPDEWPQVETSGATASYQELRARLREHYRARGLHPSATNPGSCWVGGVAAEPRVAAAILAEMLAECPTLTVWHHTRAVGATVDGERITSVTAAQHGTRQTFRAPLVIDATDLGDLLPLTGTAWVIGAESRADTGEPWAPDVAHPEWIQPFTIPIALERHPLGDHQVIPAPPGYEQLRAERGFDWRDGCISGVFDGPYPWWTYRRYLAADNFPPGVVPYDQVLVNTDYNDYHAADLPSDDPAAVLADARRLSLAYVHFMQTACAADGRVGFPELHLCTSAFDTSDGTAPQPYIRESRRILARTRVVATDLAAATQAGPRARLFADSCGLGRYMMDVHAIPRWGQPSLGLPTRPYQIPLGALIPRDRANLLAGCKNLGVTHLTNGAYRLHPTEWNIGEAAGALAAWCVARGQAPADVWGSHLHAFQQALLDRGLPLFWWDDLTRDHPAWRAAQTLAVRGWWPGGDELNFRSDQPCDEPLRSAVSTASGHSLPDGLSRGEAATWLLERLQA